MVHKRQRNTIQPHITIHSRTNDVGERKNHVVDMMRCILLEGAFPDKFWAQAVMWQLHTCIWRVFGSKAYAHVTRQKMSKSDSKAEGSIMLGYAPGCKGYRILNYKTNKVHIRQMVYFNEHVRRGPNPTEDAWGEDGNGSDQIKSVLPSAPTKREEKCHC